ncbi:hypothetical protein QL285_024697 [Trifolium repens]|nr:hypothetical protein QL285_024697 [Trifolium repens]
MADLYNCHLLDAYPKTRPGQFDHEPWMQSKLGFLGKRREVWSEYTEDVKQELKQLQDQSDPDTEEIDTLHNELQSMLAVLENYDTEIKLEKQPEKKLRKIAKVSKQQEKKKLRQIAKVPKQQKKVLEA